MAKTQIRSEAIKLQTAKRLIGGVDGSADAEEVAVDSTYFDLAAVSGTDTLQIVAEGFQDLVGAMLTDNTENGIAVTYQDTDGTIDFDVNDPIISLTGAVAGSATMTNLGNVSITTTATSDPTLTLDGDCSGSATFTDLGNATLTVIVADNSHYLASSYISDATSEATANVIVKRDASGDFAANNLSVAGITANGNISAVDMTLSGDLLVNGTQTFMDTTRWLVKDKDMVLGVAGGERLAVSRTNASPSVYSQTAHGYSTNDYIYIWGDSGSVSDGVHQVTSIDADSFSIAVDTSGDTGSKSSNMSLSAVTEATANGGGLHVPGTSLHKLIYNSTNGWDSTDDLNIATGKVFKIAGSEVLSASNLDNAVKVENANWDSTTNKQLTVTNGGTGLQAVTQGDILYASATNTISAAGPGSESNVQAWDAALDDFSGLIQTPNKIPYFDSATTMDMFDFKDEDNMSSNSDAALASQQSIKAYADNSGGAASLFAHSTVGAGGVASGDTTAHGATMVAGLDASGISNVGGDETKYMVFLDGMLQDKGANDDFSHVYDNDNALTIKWQKTLYEGQTIVIRGATV